MKIIIEFIPHKDQHYETCGDWFWEGETLVIKVSQLSNWYRSALIAIHEMYEAIWAHKHGVGQRDVDEFDKAYEKARKKGDDSEPGDDPRCPVYEGHQLATCIERTACFGLGEDWASYENEVMGLSQ